MKSSDIRTIILKQINLCGLIPSSKHTFFHSSNYYMKHVSIIPFLFFLYTYMFQKQINTYFYTHCINFNCF